LHSIFVKMLPLEFIDSMRQQLGNEAEQLLRALETEPVCSIRLNSKLDVLTFDCDTDEVPWHLDGYYLSERPRLPSTRFSTQDATMCKRPVVCSSSKHWSNMLILTV
jgi:hypothetical protein